MTADEILMDTEERMEKAVNVFRDDLRGMRTGRASPALLDSLRVEAYGSPTPVKHLAQVSAVEASGTHAERGLWLAVERGLLCHTTSAPVTFRAPPTPAVARRSSP